VKRLLVAAGFSQIDIVAFEADVELATAGLDDATRYSVAAGPAGRLLAEATPEDKARRRVRGKGARAPRARRARRAARRSLGGAGAALS
jgi:hypothetical protein